MDGDLIPIPPPPPALPARGGADRRGCETGGGYEESLPEGVWGRHGD